MRLNPVIGILQGTTQQRAGFPLPIRPSWIGGRVRADVVTILLFRRSAYLRKSFLTIRAVAKAAIPSLRPTNPIVSLVVALIPMSAGVSPSDFAIFCFMAAAMLVGVAQILQALGSTSVLAVCPGREQQAKGEKIPAHHGGHSLLSNINIRYNFYMNR